MAKLAKKLNIRKNGTVYDIPIFSTASDIANGLYFKVKVDGNVSFVPLCGISDINATPLRVRLNGVIYAGSKAVPVPYGSQEFTASGSFTVPYNVTKIYITGTGAGGGGGGRDYSGSPSTYYGDGGTGGATSVGSLLTLIGGTGGMAGHHGTVVNGSSPYPQDCLGGKGGGQHSLRTTDFNNVNLGAGGNGCMPPALEQSSVQGKGGINGADGTASTYVDEMGKTGGGGGAGQCGNRIPLTVTPGQTIAITVGAAGAAGVVISSKGAGWESSPGKAGYVLIEWGI